MSEFWKKTVFRMLQGISGGSLELITGAESHRFGDPHSDLSATVVVHNERFFSRVLLNGEDGAGDAWVDGDWSSPDPVAMIRLAIRNLKQLESGSALLSWASRLLKLWSHRRNHNSIDGSRRNIGAHYDLSNDFFRLFLDRNMVYSSAIFPTAETSLEDAQIEKIDRLCRKLRFEPGDRVLEIGTGWGAFALHAAREYGCHVTTTTISREQHDYAQELFAASGEPCRRITLLQQDYRKLNGTWNKLVSIEMFEAVGLEHYDDFFGACDRLLTPGGSLAIQTITMNEHRFRQYCRGSDWIQQRIFPGSELASVREILSSLVRSTKLSLFDLEDIGMHYAFTLAEWRRRFNEHRAEVRKLGFDEPFIRMWDYYLAYCEGAFRERQIGDVQLVLARNNTLLPLLGEPWEIEKAEVGLSHASASLFNRVAD